MRTLSLFYMNFILLISFLFVDLLGAKKYKKILPTKKNIQKKVGVYPIKKAKGAVRRRFYKEITAMPVVRSAFSEKYKKRMDLWTADLRIDELKRQLKEHPEGSSKNELIKKKIEKLQYAKKTLEELEEKNKLVFFLKENKDEIDNISEKDVEDKDDAKYKDLQIKFGKYYLGLDSDEKFNSLDTRSKEDIKKKFWDMISKKDELKNFDQGELNSARDGLAKVIDETRSDLGFANVAFGDSILRSGLKATGLTLGLGGFGAGSVGSYLAGEYDVDDVEDYEPEELGLESLEPKHENEIFSTEYSGQFSSQEEEPIDIERDVLPECEEKKTSTVIPNFLKFPEEMRLTAEEAKDSLILLAKYIRDNILLLAAKMIIDAKDPITIRTLDGERITFDGKLFAEPFLKKYEIAKNLYIKSRDRYKKLVLQKKSGEEISDESILLAKNDLAKKKAAARNAFIEKRNAINRRAIFFEIPKKGSAINIIKEGIKIIQKQTKNFNKIDIMKIFNFLEPLGFDKKDIVEDKDIEENDRQAEEKSRQQKKLSIEDELFDKDFLSYKKENKPIISTASNDAIRKESLLIVNELKNEFKKIGKEITVEEYNQFKKDLLEPKPNDDIETILTKKMAGSIWKVSEEALKASYRSVKSRIKEVIATKNKSNEKEMKGD